MLLTLTKKSKKSYCDGSFKNNLNDLKMHRKELET